MSTLPDTPALDRADEVAHSLIRTLRTLRAVRHQMPRLHPAVDPLSYPVLFRLTTGPHRVSDIAAELFEELSTVSRQVSTLAQHGLVAKTPDPQDGRAALISLTDEGRSLLDRVARERARLFGRLLHDWSDEDVATFRSSLDRLTDALLEGPLSPTPEDPA